VPPRPRARTGVTLLELLIAIALIVAMAALTFPTLFIRLGERAFANAVEVTSSQLLLARAEAQATGRPVEVLYGAGPPRIVAQWFDPAAAGEDDPGIVGEDDDDERRIERGWSYRALPGRVRISVRPPPDLLPPDDGDDPAASEETEPPFIRIAVLLPDGSALLARTVWLHDEGGRLGRLSVNAWTGLPSFRADAAIIAEDEPDADGDDDVDDMEDDEDDRRPVSRPSRGGARGTGGDP